MSAVDFFAAGDKQAPDRDAEDASNLVTYLAIKRYNPDLVTYVELLSRENRSQVSEPDAALIVEDMKAVS